MKQTQVHLHWLRSLYQAVSISCYDSLNMMEERNLRFSFPLFSHAVVRNDLSNATSVVPLIQLTLQFLFSFFTVMFFFMVHHFRQRNHFFSGGGAARIVEEKSV